MPLKDSLKALALSGVLATSATLGAVPENDSVSQDKNNLASKVTPPIRTIQKNNSLTDASEIEYAKKAYEEEKERLTPRMSDVDFQKKLDNYKKNIKGSPEEINMIMSFLKTLASEAEGRRILERAENDIIFSCTNAPQEDYYAYYKHPKKEKPSIVFNKAVPFENKALRTMMLSHELRHSVQYAEGRKNIGQQGIVGYTDLSTQKLSEVETHLFDTICAEKQNPQLNDKNDSRGTARLFRSLKNHYVGKAKELSIPQQYIDAYAQRKAKTEYIKQMWESPLNKPEDNDLAKRQHAWFEHWHHGYNLQAASNDDVICMSKMSYQREARDPKAERELISMFTKEMGIDLPPDYFRDRSKMYTKSYSNPLVGNAETYFEDSESESVRTEEMAIRNKAIEKFNFKTDEGQLMADYVLKKIPIEHSFQKADGLGMQLLNRIQQYELNPENQSPWKAPEEKKDIFSNLNCSISYQKGKGFIDKDEGTLLKDASAIFSKMQDCVKEGRQEYAEVLGKKQKEKAALSLNAALSTLERPSTENSANVKTSTPVNTAAAVLLNNRGR